MIYVDEAYDMQGRRIAYIETGTFTTNASLTIEANSK